MLVGWAMFLQGFYEERVVRVGIHEMLHEFRQRPL